MNQIARYREKSTPQGWITLILLLQSDGKCSITTRLKITRDSCVMYYSHGSVAAFFLHSLFPERSIQWRSPRQTPPCTPSILNRNWETGVAATSAHGSSTISFSPFLSRIGIRAGCWPPRPLSNLFWVAWESAAGPLVTGFSTIRTTHSRATPSHAHLCPCSGPHRRLSAQPQA